MAGGQSVTALEDAILRTILYADVFNFPLTQAELHHFLIAAVPVSRAQIAQTLAGSPRLRSLLCEQDGYIVCTDRAALIAVRQQREHAASHLMPAALRWGRWLARLPFVRMVAITGALSMRNCAAHDDDLDYMIVTTAGRVWLTRLLAVGLVRLGRVSGVTVCPNYVVAETALGQDRRDLFMAHEVAQVIPIYGSGIYAALRTDNAWVDDLLPNADGVFHAADDYQPGRGWRLLKRAAEALLGGGLGDALDGWEQRRKLRRFASALQTPHSAAKLNADQVKGHFNDHGHPVLRQYAERLTRYQVSTE